MPRTKEGALKVNERYSIREIQNEIVANPVCPGCGEPISEDNTLIISTPHEILVPTKMDQDWNILSQLLRGMVFHRDRDL